MAVAKYKLEIDKTLREAGCIVKRGRIYRPDGVFWGTRSEFMWYASQGADKERLLIEAIAQHKPKDQ